MKTNYLLILAFCYGFGLSAQNHIYPAVGVLSTSLSTTEFGGCDAGNQPPVVSSNLVGNACPATGVNLNALVTSPIPVGASLVWFTNAAHTGTAYPTPNLAVAGNYYAFYYDAVNNCYSPGSTAVIVNTFPCTPTCGSPTGSTTLGAGWYGDTNVPSGSVGPHNLPGQINATFISSVGNMIAGPGVALTSATHGGASTMDVTGATGTSLAQAVTNNDYILTVLQTAAPNPVYFSRFGTNRLSGVSQGNYTITVAVWNGVTETTLGTANLVGGTAANLPIVFATPYLMYPGNTYHIRIYLYSVTGNLYIDNPTISFQAFSPIPPVATTSVTNNTSCVAPFNGAVTVTSSASAYLWANGATSQSLTGLSAGTYNVTVTDAAGCTTTGSGTVNSSGANPVVSIVGATIICGGVPVNLSATGGMSSYNWTTPSGPATGQNQSAAVPGTYSVTVTNASGCSGNTAVTVSSFGVTATNDVSICAGQSTQLGASATSGLGQVTYSWSPTTGLSNPNIANPIANPSVNTTYTVTAGLGTGNLVTNGDFSAGNTGFTTAYLPGNGGTWGLLSNPGRYAIETNPRNTHTNFCIGGDHTTGAGNMMIVNGSDIANTNVWCQTIPVQPNSSYNFAAWAMSVDPGSPAILQFSVNGNQLGSVVNLPVTTCQWQQFSATWNSGANTSATICILSQNTSGGGNDFAIDDISFVRTNACLATDQVVVTVNPTPTVSITGQVSVCQGNSGTFDAGPGFTSYSWSLPGGGSANTQTVTTAQAGTYRVTVVDGNGCAATATRNFAVNNNPQPAISGATSICPGGSTTFDAGPGYINYSWSLAGAGSAATRTVTASTAGQYTVTVTNSNGCIGITSVTLTVGASINPTITGDLTLCPGQVSTLDAGSYSTYIWSDNTTGRSINISAAGDYSVTITDAAGCRGSSTVTASVLTAPVVTITGNTLVCIGGSTILDAGPGASYIWSTPAGTVNTRTVVGSPGPYNLTLTDANGCEGTASATVIEQTINATGDATICETASATLGVTASNPIAYSWSPSASLTGANTANPVASPTTTTTYTVTVTQQTNNLVSNGDFELGNTGFSSSLAFVPTGTSTAQGVYSIRSNPQTHNTAFGACNDHTPSGSQMMIVDAATTVGSNVWCQTVAVQPNTDYYFSAWVTSMVPASPGVLQFNINGSALGGQYTIPGNVCDWSQYLSVWNSGANTTANICIVSQNPTAAGNDFALDDISFGQVCFATDQVTITVNPRPTPNITGNNLICRNTTTTFDAGAGYTTYAWTIPGANASTQTVVAGTGGTYTVVVTDGNGCTGSDSETLTFRPDLTPSITGNNSICTGGTTTFDAGAGFSTYAWTTPGGNASTQTVSANAAGTYTVVVTDADGCQGTANRVLIVNSNPTPTITGNLSICNGSSTTLDAGAYSSYAWTTPSGNAATQTVSASTAGNYSVVVTDGNGCQGSANVNVSVTTLTATATVANETCAGLNDGSVTVNPSYPATFTYTWTPNVSTTATASNLAPGAYTITLTDGLCSATVDATVGGGQVVTVDAGPDQTIDINSTATLNATATPGVTYVWTGGGQASTDQQWVVSPTEATVYTVVVSLNGCTATDNVAVNVNIFGDVNIPNAFTPNGDGVNEIFKPEIIGNAEVVKLQVYNRWGRLVYEGVDGWDGFYSGEVQPRDVYMFSLEVLNCQEPVYFGEMTLIR